MSKARMIVELGDFELDMSLTPSGLPPQDGEEVAPDICTIVLTDKATSESVEGKCYTRANEVVWAGKWLIANVVIASRDPWGWCLILFSQDWDENIEHLHGSVSNYVEMMYKILRFAEKSGEKLLEEVKKNKHSVLQFEPKEEGMENAN